MRGRPTNSIDINQYELPPAPMAGMFDIRFSSGRIAEDLNSSMQTIDMSGVTYPLTVRVENMDIRLMDETGKAINVNLKSGENVVISDASVMKLMVSSQLIPEQYALEQNYPNPFNLSTVIEFSLPENVGNVKFSIYNTLGEKVAELINTALVAGKYSYQWKAKNVTVDLGYRGHDYDGQAQVNIANRLTMKKEATSLIKWLKRRSAIEPIFGHLKSDNRLERNLLKGKEGDHINAVLAACGFNLRKLYAVFLLPILKWLNNRITEKYFLLSQQLDYKTFVFIENK